MWFGNLTGLQLVATNLDLLYISSGKYIIISVNDITSQL